MSMGSPPLQRRHGTYRPSAHSGACSQRTRGNNICKQTVAAFDHKMTAGLLESLYTYALCPSLVGHPRVGIAPIKDPKISSLPALCRRGDMHPLCYRRTVQQRIPGSGYRMSTATSHRARPGGGSLPISFLHSFFQAALEAQPRTVPFATGKSDGCWTMPRPMPPTRRERPSCPHACCIRSPLVVRLRKGNVGDHPPHLGGGGEGAWG